MNPAWLAPSTPRPVRARITVPVSPSGAVDPVAAAAFAAAGIITGGTVLVRNWPHGDAAGDFAADCFAQLGAYVIASPAGLTATSRSTAGVLAPVDLAVGPHQRLVPLLAALGAVRASGACRLSGVTPEIGDAVRRALAALGGRAVWADGALVIEPSGLRGGRWDSGSPGMELAGLELAGMELAGVVLALMVPGVTVAAWGEVRDRFPGFEAEWLRMVSLEEYLVPGSAALPHDYLR